MASCEEVITHFCESLGWDGADDEIVHYLASVIQDSDDGSDLDLDEFAELVQGFFPGFAALAPEEQHDRLWHLVEQVQSCHSTGSDENFNMNSNVLPTTAKPVSGHGSSDSHMTSQEPGRRQHASDAAACAADSAPGGRPTSRHADEDALDVLARIWPAELPQNRDFLHHVLLQGLGSVEAAATWMLECGDLGREQQVWTKAQEDERRARERAAAREKAARKATITRFGLQAEPSMTATAKGRGRCQGLPDVAPYSAPDEGRKGERYIDGRLATTRGEKFIIETKGDSWDGGSKGKVITKGKRGKGFV